MWKPIKGYEGFYEITEQGDVRRVVGSWCQRTRPVTVCADTEPRGNPTRRVRLCNRTKPYKRYLIHRLVYEAFVGPIPKGLTINHLDGNRANNHPSNLEIATMREQMIHAYATGLQQRAKGVNRGKVAKLTDLDVLDIRKRYRRHVVTGRMLGKEFGVTAACILSVVNRKRWTHI
jgi:hypothetical protein